VQIVPYSSAHHDAVERLNARLAEAGSSWSFPHRERPREWETLPAWDESFVATDGDEVYGGYVLKHRRFFLQGEALDLGALQMPLSLGEVDSAYAHVSVALLLDAIRRSPYLFSLGLGSETTKFARLLDAAEWRHLAVPFYFSVKAANRFAREIRLPDSRAALQVALRALGRARLAGAALALRRALATRSRRSHRARPPAEAQEITTFDGSLDELIARHLDAYVLIADRSEATLQQLYPPDDDRYIHLAVRRGGETVGWAMLVDTPMRDNIHFGDLRVGTIADGFAAPGEAQLVIAAADELLTARGVDLVLTNQLHHSWCEALEAVGYERGPSNFFLYYSDRLAERLDEIGGWEREAHVNRGDGEGPGHLLDLPAA